jgi:hypothetical protein
MSVESFRHAEIVRLEKALQDHDDKDDQRFGSLERQQSRMAGSLEVVVDNQAALMTALGMRHGSNDEKIHKPVALMPQRELFWKAAAGMSGILVFYKIVAVALPFLIGAAKAIAHIP